MQRDNDLAVEKARVTRPQNHRWKPVGRKGVKGLIDSKKCKRCGLEARRVRRGAGARGWILTQCRVLGGSWRPVMEVVSMPKCIPRVVCPHCKGTGQVVDFKGVGNG